jgi:transposase
MKMAPTEPIIAIDVSKDRLDCLDEETGESFALENAAAGWAELVRRGQARATQFVLEASGGLERPVVRELCGVGLIVRLVDPRKVRLFARACGCFAKNDRLDARMIAAYARTVPGIAHQPDPDQERLAELATYRRQLLDEQAALASQTAGLRDPVLLPLPNPRATVLTAQLALVDKRIARHIEASPALAAKARLLRSIPGVGPVLCTALLAFLPELGQLGRQQVAALAGVAPMDNDSGRRKGTRSIYGGRPALRAVLYMAALVATRHNPPLATFYERLRAAGKKPKVAIVAVMRKLVILANALVRDDRPYQPA